jgi:Family of unknown function (DUF5670)
MYGSGTQKNKCGVSIWDIFSPFFGLLDCFGIGPKVVLPVLTYKQSIMRSLLYTIAVILVICWAIGFLGYHAGGIIHLLLVIALISILLGVIRRA